MGSEHTPEPWRVEHNANGAYWVVAPRSGGCEVRGAADPYYGGILIAESLSRQNAHRIVACVNACAGLPTEKLERNTLHYMEEVDTLRTQNAALLEALKEAEDGTQEQANAPAHDAAQP